MEEATHLQTEYKHFQDRSTPQRVTHSIRNPVENTLVPFESGPL